MVWFRIYTNIVPMRVVKAMLVNALTKWCSA